MFPRVPEHLSDGYPKFFFSWNIEVAQRSALASFMDLSSFLVIDTHNADRFRAGPLLALFRVHLHAQKKAKFSGQGDRVAPRNVSACYSVVVDLG
jgi:hypothetical protein